MRALIYTRVSSDRAQGRSVREQEAEARRVCDREGWTVAQVVTDSVGASRHSKGKRSGWEQAKGMLKAGDVDVLVTWEASRAQRDLMAYAELRDLCVETKTLWCYSGRVHDLSSGHDRFTTGLDALLAEREADMIAERVHRSVRANALAGRPHGRRLFGYRRLYDDASGLLIGQEPHPEEAPVVRRIFAEYLAGVGVRTIVRSLDADGITTGTGATFDFTQIARVLTNPAYAARRVYQGEVIGDADWPALVDPDDFDRAQTIRASRRHPRSPSTARLLTAVLRCGVCGSKMYAGHDRKTRKTYNCRQGFCVARDLVKLDAYVSAAIVARVETIDADLLADHDDDPQAAVELRTQIATLERRLDDVVQQFTKGDLSARMLARVEQATLAEIADLRRQLRQFAIPAELDLPTEAVGEWWDDLDPERRREYVGALIEVVVIHKTRQGERYFDPSKVEIVWR